MGFTSLRVKDKGFSFSASLPSVLKAIRGVFMGVRWRFMVVLTLGSVTTHDIEQLFMFSLATCTAPLKKCLCKLLPGFELGCLVFM